MATRAEHSFAADAASTGSTWRIDPRQAGGSTHVKEFSPECILVIADALAKRAALHRDESEVEAAGFNVSGLSVLASII
jgi:hypothetical protein